MFETLVRTLYELESYPSISSTDFDDLSGYEQGKYRVKAHWLLESLLDQGFILVELEKPQEPNGLSFDKLAADLQRMHGVGI